MGGGLDLVVKWKWQAGRSKQLNRCLLVGLFSRSGVLGDSGGGSGFSPDFSWLRCSGGSVWLGVSIWNQSTDKCMGLI